MSEDQLKAVGLKVTTPRIKILSLLSQLDQPHITAEQVYQALRDTGEDVGLATVYRVLTQFEQAGLVTRHHFNANSPLAGNQAIFELCDNHHHDHLLCLDCGQVKEFTNQTIEAEQARIAKQLGFTLEEHTLHLYGRCQSSDCPHRP